MDSFDTFKVVKREKGWYWRKIRVHQGGPPVLYVTALSDYKGPYTHECLAWEAAVATPKDVASIPDSLSPEQLTIIDVIHAYHQGVEVLSFTSKDGVVKDVHGLAVSAIKRYGDDRTAQELSFIRRQFEAGYGSHSNTKWSRSMRKVLDKLGVVEAMSKVYTVRIIDNAFDELGVVNKAVACKEKDMDERIAFSSWCNEEHPHASRQEVRLMREAYLQARKEQKR